MATSGISADSSTSHRNSGVRDLGPSEPSEQADGHTQNAHLTLSQIDDDRAQRRVLGLEDHAVAVALKALDGRLPASLRLHHGDDDVVGLRAVLTVNEDEVAVADVSVDHALAPHPQR